MFILLYSLHPHVRMLVGVRLCRVECEGLQTERRKGQVHTSVWRQAGEPMFLTTVLN